MGHRRAYTADWFPDLDFESLFPEAFTECGFFVNRSHFECDIPEDAPLRLLAVGLTFSNMDRHKRSLQMAKGRPPVLPQRAPDEPKPVKPRKGQAYRALIKSRKEAKAKRHAIKRREMISAQMHAGHGIWR